MIENKKWTAFFSHTGSEIYNVSKKIGRLPDRIVTNSKPGSQHINKQNSNNYLTLNTTTFAGRAVFAATASQQGYFC